MKALPVAVLAILMGAPPTMSQERPQNIIESLRLDQFAMPEYPTDGLPYAYTIRSWQIAQAKDMDTWHKYVLLQKALGYNNISIDIPWAVVEGEQGKYDFSIIQPYLRFIADEDMTLQLKLNSRMMPEWAKADPDALLHDSDGNLIEEGFVKGSYHGFADPKLNAALRGFYRATAEHFRDWPNLFYCSAFAVSFESEYHHTVWTDYSPAAQRQMREYLRAQYDSVEVLNAAWGTEYGGWDDVQIAWRPPETMKGDDPDRRYVDFMKYREWAARLFFDNVVEGLREGDPDAQYGPQVGRIVGPVAMRRGTLSAFHWAASCDWIFVDPSPADDYAWELAVARAGGKSVAVEIDGPYMFRNLNLDDQLPALYAEQTRLSYLYGAAYVCHANWGETRDYERCRDEGMFKRAAEAKLAEYELAPATDAVYVSKWDCYLFGNQPGHSMAASKQRFQALRDQGKEVDAVLDDTILQTPAQLDKYEKVHVCGAKFVAREVWGALTASQAELILGEGVDVLRNETGTEEWNAR